MGEPDEVAPGFIRRAERRPRGTNFIYYLRAAAPPSANYYVRNEWKIVIAVDGHGYVTEILNLDSDSGLSLIIDANARHLFHLGFGRQKGEEKREGGFCW